MLHDPNPGIATLAKQDTVGVIKFLAKQLHETVQFWAVGRSAFDGDVGKRQIVELIRLIIDEYPHLKISDIKLVFANAKKGHYGTAYNRMDGAMIMEWFMKYHEERIRQAEEANIRRHKSIAHQTIEDDKRTPEQRKADILKMAGIFGEVAKKFNTPEPSGSTCEFVPITDYESIDEWCISQGIDPEKYLSEWEATLKNDIINYAAMLGTDYENIKESLKRTLLREINYGLHEVWKFELKVNQNQ